MPKSKQTAAEQHYKIMIETMQRRGASELEIARAVASAKRQSAAAGQRERLSSLDE
jgi:hypothetical protein